MTDKDLDEVEFDQSTALALARAAEGASPDPGVKRRLLERVVQPSEGFVFRFERDADWVPHPVPGIRMKVLALNKRTGYATLLLDVEPGTRFPPHHHTDDEECYLVSGSAYSFGRRLGPGDFLHADADTDHTELYTEEGCRVILVVPHEDYMPAPPA